MNHNRERRKKYKSPLQEIQTQIPLKYVVIAVSIVFLSALDALFTIVHIDNGAEEIMPFMRWALSQGNLLFVTIKMAITAVGALALCMWYKVNLARLGLMGLLIGYGILSVYHMVLANTFWSM